MKDSAARRDISRISERLDNTREDFWEQIGKLTNENTELKAEIGMLKKANKTNEERIKRIALVMGWRPDLISPGSLSSLLIIDHTDIRKYSIYKIISLIMKYLKIEIKRIPEETVIIKQLDGNTAKKPGRNG